MLHRQVIPVPERLRSTRAVKRSFRTQILNQYLGPYLNQSLLLGSPQVAQMTSQPPSPTRTRQAQRTKSVESVQTPGSTESVESVNTHTANLLEDVKYFHNAALSYQDAYEALQVQQVELQTKFTEQAQLVQEASDALRANEVESAAHQQELVSELTTLRDQTGS